MVSSCKSSDCQHLPTEQWHHLEAPVLVSVSPCDGAVRILISEPLHSSNAAQSTFPELFIAFSSWFDRSDKSFVLSLGNDRLFLLWNCELFQLPLLSSGTWRRGLLINNWEIFKMRDVLLYFLLWTSKFVFFYQAVFYFLEFNTIKSNS